jgi:hypothetical protein
LPLHDLREDRRFRRLRDQRRRLGLISRANFSGVQALCSMLRVRLQSHHASCIELDAFRKKRNQNDYLGVAVSEGEADEAIAAAAELLATVESHLKSHYPQLLQDFRK